MTEATNSHGAMTRRSLIGAGAALGASLYLPSWSWAGPQSVAGIGGSTPPWLVWDDEADAVIAAVIERGEVAAVNALLRGWTKNSQPLPDGLPADLREFIEDARKLPAWADVGKLKAAVDFNKKRGTYLGVAYGFVSGMMSTVIPHEARAVYYSRGGADMKRRISRTAKFGYDIGSLGGFHEPKRRDGRHRGQDPDGARRGAAPAAAVAALAGRRRRAASRSASATSSSPGTACRPR